MPQTDKPIRSDEMNEWKKNELSEKCDQNLLIHREHIEGDRYCIALHITYYTWHGKVGGLRFVLPQRIEYFPPACLYTYRVRVVIQFVSSFHSTLSYARRVHFSLFPTQTHTHKYGETRKKSAECHNKFMRPSYITYYYIRHRATTKTKTIDCDDTIVSSTLAATNGDIESRYRNSFYFFSFIFMNNVV